jgi:hypothetical protein
VKKHVKKKMSEKERTVAISNATADLEAEAGAGNNYDIKVKSFFEGNEFYMFVYETFHDVRLVGTPPESIGKFGGDTDNWMWPRHTGDFSLFRVYAGPDGKPAEYSPDNIPLKPRYHLPVSLDGVQENDFAMVLGYPGSTNRYLTSFGVEMAIEKVNPARVKVRGKKLEIMKEGMDEDPAVRLAYASKYASVANYWKYFIGQTKGLKKLDVYEQKKAIEQDLTTWINSKNSRKKAYGNPVADIEHAYKNVKKYSYPFYYLYEAGFGIEFVKSSYKLAALLEVLNREDFSQEQKQVKANKYRSASAKFFKDYNPEIDKYLFESMMEYLVRDVDPEYLPEVFKYVAELGADEEFNFVGFEPSADASLESFAEYIFSNSILVSEEKLMEFYNNPKVDMLKNDPGYIVSQSVYDAYKSLSAKRGAALSSLSKGRRNFIAALRQMNDKKDFYPDANSTMRLTYGKVSGYEGRDAVHFDYLTTLKGVMEKEDATNPEFIVHPKLKALYEAKDYGQYASPDGKLYVGFISNNDITGGNSGSPVINGNGHLIGTAFDGNWEAMSGDIAFEPKLQRCISVDIRYTLFIIDKFAGARHLIDEMTIVKNGMALSRGN